MRLVGKRIIIRDLREADLDDYYEYGKGENVGPNAGWKPFTSREIARRVLLGNMFAKNVFAIEEISSGKMIGSISIYENGLRKYKYVKSLGFSLNEAFWGKGLMTEAVGLVVDYIFTKTNCEVLEVGHHSDNYGSKRVIEKSGFLYDGRLCKYKVLYDGRIVDADFYSMTKEDYERKKRYERA